MRLDISEIDIQPEFESFIEEVYYRRWIEKDGQKNQEFLPMKLTNRVHCNTASAIRSRLHLQQPTGPSIQDIQKSDMKEAPSELQKTEQRSR